MNGRPPPLAVRFGKSQGELKLTPAQHLVALTISLYARADGGGMRPGVALLARTTDLTERAVYAALRVLEARRVIVVTDPGGGRGRATEYRLNPELHSPNSGRETLNGRGINPERTGGETLNSVHPKRLEEVLEEGGDTLNGPVGSRRRRQTPEEAEAIAEGNRHRARASRAQLLADGLVQPTRPDDRQILEEEIARRQAATA